MPGISRFEPKLDQEDVGDLLCRLRATRFPTIQSGDSWAFGTASGHMERIVNHWISHFDFAAFEEGLKTLPNYMFEIDGISLHFLHFKSPNKRAIPLLITHGWPSTFLEALPMIRKATAIGDNGSDLLSHFHVVVPSLPGFGFSSPPPQLHGYGGAAIADLWAKLMTAIGYDRFLASGGDIGARVSAWLGARHPERILGVHVSSNALWPVLPTTMHLEADEEEWVNRRARWAVEEGAYMHIQQTKPLTLAYGLSDSPVGLAGWLLEKWWGWSGSLDWSSQRVIDRVLAQVSLFWFTNTVSTSFMPYFVYDLGPGARPWGRDIKAPTSFYLCEAEIGGIPPLSYALKQYDVSRWAILPSGGHFTATEEPRLLANDLIEFAQGLDDTSSRDGKWLLN